MDNKENETIQSQLAEKDDKLVEIQAKLNIIENNNQQLRTENHDLIVKSNQLRHELFEQKKKRIDDFKVYCATVKHFEVNFRKYIQNMLLELDIANDEMNAIVRTLRSTSVTTTTILTPSHTESAKRTPPVTSCSAKLQSLN